MDLETLAEAFPGVTQNLAATRYHDKNDKIFKGAFNGARAVKVAIMSGKPVPTFGPPTSVHHFKSRSQAVFYDVGVASESDLVRLSELSSQAAGRKSIPIELEDASGGSSNAFLIGLRGLPADEIAAMRKIRVKASDKIVIDEKLLESTRQLHQEQGSLLFDHAAKAHSLNLHCNNVQRTRLPTISTIKTKADAIIKEMAGVQEHGELYNVITAVRQMMGCQMCASCFYNST